jgi:hypothetical protein
MAKALQVTGEKALQKGFVVRLLCKRVRSRIFIARNEIAPTDSPAQLYCAHENCVNSPLYATFDLTSAIKMRATRVTRNIVASQHHVYVIFVRNVNAHPIFDTVINVDDIEQTLIKRRFHC